MFQWWLVQCQEKYFIIHEDHRVDNESSIYPAFPVWIIPKSKWEVTPSNIITNNKWKQNYGVEYHHFATSREFTDPAYYQLLRSRKTSETQILLWFLRKELNTTYIWSRQTDWTWVWWSLYVQWRKCREQRKILIFTISKQSAKSRLWETQRVQNPGSSTEKL